MPTKDGNDRNGTLDLDHGIRIINQITFRYHSREIRVFGKQPTLLDPCHGT